VAAAAVTAGVAAGATGVAAAIEAMVIGDAVLGASAVRRVGAQALAAALFLAAAGAAARPAPSVSIRASGSGFEPSELVLRKGEAVTIVLSSADREHCFAVDALRIEKRILPGRPTSFDFTPDRAGRFPFYCCLESGAQAEVERGVLVITE
jgi:heme/copper-type cytochrome/quinol oxidase subunit 2